MVCIKPKKVHVLHFVQKTGLIRDVITQLHVEFLLSVCLVKLPY